MGLMETKLCNQELKSERKKTAVCDRNTGEVMLLVKRKKKESDKRKCSNR